MRLGAAIASSESPVRAWVIASSASVYAASSYGPLLHRETGDVDTVDGAQAESIREAEDYARDVAARRPHLNVSLLRLQHLVGEGVHSPMSALLGQPVLPRVIGHDPLIQMLAIDDAVCALAYAAELELAGVYNVASAGTIRMSELIRSLGRPSLPVLPFETGRALARYADRFGVPHVPPGMLDVLRFGHALDTSKLAAAGFTPEHDQESCLDTFRAGR
jgi:UDP-glucose 4-epimerase